MTTPTLDPNPNPNRRHVQATLVGVGVGPGDPELVTVKALRILESADIVFVPVSDGNGPYGALSSSQGASGSSWAQLGRAEATVRAHVSHGRIHRLPFRMTGDADYATPAAVVAAVLTAVPGEAASTNNSGQASDVAADDITTLAAFPAPPTAAPDGTASDSTRGQASGNTENSGNSGNTENSGNSGNSDVTAGLTATVPGGDAGDSGVGSDEAPGKVVAFATIGDPNVYSTFTQLAAHVRGLVPGVVVETVPGIMALQDLAARSGTVLAHGSETLALLPLTAGVDAYRRAVADHDTVVAYKGGRALPQVRAVLDEAGRLDGSGGAAVYGAALGLPGADIRLAGDVPAEPGPYLSTVIATRRPLWPRNPTPHDYTTDIDHRRIEVGRDGAHADIGSAGAARHGDTDGDTDIDGAAFGSDSGAGKGRVTFVGAGPGAVDLLTLRGARVIAEADVVVWASSLVHPDVVAHARPEAQVVDSAGIPLEAVAAIYRRAAAGGLHVARVHSGDPALWGAVHEQLEVCATLGLETDVVPGVSSVTAAAAAIQQELTVPEIAQTVILARLGGGRTPMPPGEQVRDLARHGTTMALFLSTARSAQLQRELLDGGYPADTPCVVAYRVSWPEELVVRCMLGELASTVKGHRLWKHTLVLVGPALAAGGTRSHLYHPGHFHGFRRAEPQARADLRAHDASLAHPGLSGRPGRPGRPGRFDPSGRPPAAPA